MSGTHRPPDESLISQSKHAMGTQKDHLNEMVLLSTQNIHKTDG